MPMNKFYHDTNPENISCSISLERQAFYFSMEQRISGPFRVDPVLKNISNKDI